MFERDRDLVAQLQYPVRTLHRSAHSPERDNQGHAGDGKRLKDGEDQASTHSEHPE